MSRDYREYCPISLGAEVFAERWTPLILRNLVLGSYRFSDILAGAPGLPRSVLVSRLRQLEADGVVARSNSGLATEYHLTQSGQELAELAMALGNWGARWRHRVVSETNPLLVLWVLAHLIPTEEIERDQVVVEFAVSGAAKPDRLWLVVTPEGSEALAADPGLEVDGVVSCDAEVLIDWHNGVLPLATAIRRGDLTVDGPRWLVRLLGSWGRLSPFAGMKPVAESRGLVAAG